MDCEASVPTEPPNEPAKTSFTVTKKELFLVLKSDSFYKLTSSKCNDCLLRYIVDKFNVVTELPLDIRKQLSNILKVFVSKCLKKWKECKQIYDRFMIRNAKWLDGELKLPPLHQIEISVPIPIRKVGKERPKKLFSESSERTKRRHVMPLVSEVTAEQLCEAAKTSLAKTGKRTAAQVVKLALDTTPRRFKKMKKIHDSSSTSSIKGYTPEEALALIIDLGLGKEEYISIQRGAKERGADIYPSYNVIAEVKKQCYPPNIKITETEAQIPLQDLVDLTIRRLVQVQSEVLLQHVPVGVTEVSVIYKWGLDGSGGHSIYKQNFTNNSQYADSNIVLCTIVPLEISKEDLSDKKIFWKNPSPSSLKYCRVICFKLMKETNQTTRTEYIAIEAQIAQLQPTKVSLGDRELSFKHIPVCTMIDGKTCNVLTDTGSSQTCNVCKATPNNMNDLKKILERPCNTSSYKFGISVLHAYLRCYEFLLHIAYKLDKDCKQWQAKTQAAKESVKKNKKKISSLFYKEMGLVVDLPKQGGGNSNDGNTARKFFENPAKSALITGIDEELITRFSCILTAISSCHYIDTDKFKTYCFDTAQLCVNLYEWYKMSATVHKLLIHGSDIIKCLPLPVGQFSEDVLEASHKQYKYLRLFRARKFSRIETNTDIVNWMLVSSDPVISAYRKNTKKKRKPFCKDVLNMLKLPDFLKEVQIDRADDIDDDIIDDVA